MEKIKNWKFKTDIELDHISEEQMEKFNKRLKEILA